MTTRTAPPGTLTCTLIARTAGHAKRLPCPHFGLPLYLLPLDGGGWVGVKYRVKC